MAMRRRRNFVRHLLRWLTSKSDFCASKHEHVQQYLIVKIALGHHFSSEAECLGGIYGRHFGEFLCGIFDRPTVRPAFGSPGNKEK